MDSVGISSITQSVNNNLVYKRSNGTYMESEVTGDVGYVSPHKKLCTDLQYNNNNNEYISEESEESDSEAQTPYSPPLVESGPVTSQEPSFYSTQGGAKEGTTPDRKKTKGRLKVEMKYLEDKLKRNTTFNKRKNGMLKKAYELSTLTGTEILVVIASEAGYIHTFATKKLQPVIASQQGQEFIQDCLMSEDDPDTEVDLCAGGTDPTQNGVISKWKANKQKSHGGHVTTSHVTAAGQSEVPSLPNLATHENGLAQPTTSTSVSSPLYGQAAKSEPLYDGIYGQMPQTAQAYSLYTGGTQEDKSNSSYSNLSPPPTTSILQGALSGTVDTYVQQYTPQVCTGSTHQSVVSSIQASKHTAVQQSTTAGYTYSLPDYQGSSQATQHHYTHTVSRGDTPPTHTASTDDTPPHQTTETSTEYEFETDPGKTVYIKVPVKEEPAEVGCYWS